MALTGKALTQSEKTRRPRVTVKDIAKEMDLSVATVSRAFNNDSTIARKTLKRVLETGKKMGYSPNLFARSLITEKSGIAAIFTSNITNPFYPEVVVKLTQRLQSVGLHTMLFSTEGSHGTNEVIPLLTQYRPDFVITLAASMSSDTVKQCMDMKTPVLLFNRYVADRITGSVCCDNLAGGRLVARALAKAGHKKLSFISGLADASTSVDRSAGFRLGCMEAGLDDPIVIPSVEFSYQSGFDGMLKLFSDKNNRPDAVFCANDLLAIGAIEAARKPLGLRIPEDVSIVGFDDIQMASWSSYDLTTVRQPMENMIDQILSEVQKLQNGDDWQPNQHFIPGRLIVRGSARLSEDEI